MRRTTAGLMSLALASGLGVTLSTQAAAVPAAPPVTTPQESSSAPDSLPNPIADKDNQLRQAAITKVINGQAAPQQINGSTVVKLDAPADSAPSAAAGQKAAKDTTAKDQYVRLSREQTDKIFVVLAEFGNERDPRFPDKDIAPTIQGPATFEGPLHNQIPEPNRALDNSTIWQPDYNADHYRQLYFGSGAGVESLKTYYQRQSSGRYSVEGQVTEWVKVKYNEARYGRSDDNPTDANGNDPAVCASNVCSNTWDLLKDAVIQWVADQKTAGKTDAEIAANVKSLDVQDRYDYNHNGNFNEPDGYIDHFQIVHAGGDQADGDKQQGEDAIWSHRWYAYYPDQGKTGPTYNKFGGFEIPGTGVWIGDYTIQPENGGLSVFAHEFGHDLGLPDHYDTAGGPDNAVNWWTLMAQSRASAKGDVGIGTRPADLGAWDKLQLGWLDYEVVPASTNRTLEIGPHEYNTDKAQGIVVPLPKKEVKTNNPAPVEGTKSWYSGTGDDLNSSMSRQVNLPAGASTLTFKAAYDIEDCDETPCDYAFVEVDDGSGFKAIPGTIANAAEGNGIDGSTNGAFVPASFDLSAYAGKSVGLRIRYVTDAAQQGNVGDPNRDGIFVDDIKVTAGTTVVLADGAENGANGWTLNGFTAVGATSSSFYDNYYIASNREYISYDRYLQTGPYNFIYNDATRKLTEHFPYQDGLLISYWDKSQSNNNESQHPGEGLILPIDSHPQAIYQIDGTPWRGRVQTYDSPFSLEKADSFSLHILNTGQLSYIRGQAAQPVFDDSRSYWDPAIPTVGVKVPNTGTRIRVVSHTGTSMRVAVTSTK